MSTAYVGRNWGLRMAFHFSYGIHSHWSERKDTAFSGSLFFDSPFLTLGSGCSRPQLGE